MKITTTDRIFAAIFFIPLVLYFVGWAFILVSMAHYLMLQILSYLGF